MLLYKELTKVDYEEKLPLLSVINNIEGVIRWCTPSIHPSVPKVRGIYDNDISISYHTLGNPALNTGVFKKAQELAAKAYKADYTLFSVNGSSGSNFVVLKALKHQLKKVNILAQRNTHKSISVAVEDYGINVNYLHPRYDDNLQIFIPNTIEDILKGLIDYPETNVLLLTNPTYEGLSIDLPFLMERVRAISPEVIVFIDEAWGAHLPFSKELPICAMEAKADISVQSAHKQGSGLQQTSFIHWQGKRIDKACLMDAYKSLSTTSPSFHLLASLDGARYLMETKGEEIIGELLEVADSLRSGLSKIESLNVIFPDEIARRHRHVKYLDRSKVIINVEKTNLPGFEIAHHLETQYGVIVEKYEADNIFFLATLQNKQFEVDRTVEFFRKTLSDLSEKRRSRSYKFPPFPVTILKRFPSYRVAGMDQRKDRIEEAIGKVCAEDIVPYPPGIPLVVKGEIIQKDHIEYFKAIRNFKDLISVVMSDDSLETILTV